MEAPARTGTGMRVALLGAESTGKTALSLALACALRQRGTQAAAVPELLRNWCERAGRTPRADEQLAIARGQADRVAQAEQAIGPHGVVVADTTPLMTAVYSDLLFGDRALYPFALEHQRSYRHTLLMGLDLPWVADGLQRDGPQVRGPVDDRVRAALSGAGLAFHVVHGAGPGRLQQALAALGEHAPPGHCTTDTAAYSCERCSSGDCEHALFRRLLRTAG